MKPQKIQVAPHPQAETRVENAAPPKRKRPRPQLTTLHHGSITTTVWANRTPWGEIVWRVSQVREYPKTNGRGFTTNFPEEDLPHALRGLKEAQKTIRKAKTQLVWRRLFGKSW